MSEPLLRLPEAAAELSVSLSTVKRLVAAGELPVVRVGSAVRVRPEDLRRFVLGATERRIGASTSSSAAGVSLRKGARLWD